MNMERDEFVRKEVNKILRKILDEAYTDNNEVLLEMKDTCMTDQRNEKKALIKEDNREQNSSSNIASHD